MARGERLPPSWRCDVLLRPVDADDEDRLLEWVNDPEVRAGSSKSPISSAEHHLWLAERLADPNTAMYVAADDRGCWGQVRFEPRADDETELGFSIAADRRGEGLAAPLLRSAVQRVFADRPSVTRVCGPDPARKRSLGACV